MVTFLVVFKQGAGPDSGSHSGGYGLYSPGGAARLPGDGPEEEAGGGALPARQAGGNQSPPPARQHAQDPSGGEAHLVGRPLPAREHGGLAG